MFFFFFFNDTATTEIYTLSLHDALPISCPSAKVSFSLSLENKVFLTARIASGGPWAIFCASEFTSASSSVAGRSEEHTSELQSRLHLVCRLLLEKKKHKFHPDRPTQSPH